MDISQKGLAGEFYALAQLTARGFNASLTLGNTKGVDILVINKKNKGYKVEVKTTTIKPTKSKIEQAKQLNIKIILEKDWNKILNS